MTKNTSNDLYGFFAFLMVPPGDPFPKELHSHKVCGIVWCYTGPIEKAEEVFKPIREFGPPILDWVGEMPMPELNGLEFCKKILLQFFVPLYFHFSIRIIVFFHQIENSGMFYGNELQSGRDIPTFLHLPDIDGPAADAMFIKKNRSPDTRHP